MVGSLRINGGEDDKDQLEDDRGDDDGDCHGDEDEPIPMAYASLSACRPGLRKGKGLISSFMSMTSKIAGSRQKRPEKSRPPTNPTQRKKAMHDVWEQTGPADGGPQDPVIISSYSGLIVSGVDSSLFTDKSGNNVPGKLGPLVKNVCSISFDILVFSYVCPNSETGSKVVKAVYPEVCDIGIQNGAQINRYPHSFRLDDRRRGQPYMPDRVVRQFGWVQCIPAYPIRPLEHHRPVNNGQYMFLLDMISREVDADDVDLDTKIGRISDMLKKYNQPRR
ncbi:hypothetical protein M9H77_12840 [Catharanthus roseus]|uniref:Uncharacterized protein n=1 Tax=Catharanthus roseus TaxID=4058 RepID=A0ACC0BIQ7_CATRO|nr:hypothetical protein M9H77_12840 [Catharanthus roseus]